MKNLDNIPSRTKRRERFGRLARFAKGLPKDLYCTVADLDVFLYKSIAHAALTGALGDFKGERA
jgi:hypothetical protein